MSSMLPSGKNSWSGGSNSRIVTGSPEFVQFEKLNLEMDYNVRSFM